MEKKKQFKQTSFQDIVSNYYETHDASLNIHPELSNSVDEQIMQLNHHINILKMKKDYLLQSKIIGLSDSYYSNMYLNVTEFNDIIICSKHAAFRFTHNLSTVMFIDGTFKVVFSTKGTKLFYQVLLIHCAIESNDTKYVDAVFTCIMVLMGGKQTKRYEAVAKAIQNQFKLKYKITIKDNIRCLSSDLEHALFQVFSKIGERQLSMKQFLCFFHLSKAFYAHIVQEGMKIMYRENKQFRIDIMLIPFSAYLPPNDVANFVVRHQMALLGLYVCYVCVFTIFLLLLCFYISQFRKI